MATVGKGQMFTGLRSAKPRPPVSDLRHIQRPGWNGVALCYGRALTGAVWGTEETPIKEQTCPRCWGIWVASRGAK